MLGAAGVAGTALVLAAGYGWWHAASHATFEVQIVYAVDPRVANRMRNGQLEFLDANDAVLARASIDTRRNVVWLAHPDRGQCGPELARDAYVECARAQAEWIPRWAEHVRRANVAFERCNVAHVHVNVHTTRDRVWWWWLPLPQSSGKPYTRHTARLAISQRQCE